MLLPWDITVGALYSYRTQLPWSATGGRDLNLDSFNTDLVRWQRREDSGSRELNRHSRANAYRTSTPLRTLAIQYILMIHGGLHAQQGPGFVHKSQTYAGHGWPALMVNYRGSTGYRAGALERHRARPEWNRSAGTSWLRSTPRSRSIRGSMASSYGIEGGSYGGQLTNWIITQTPRFKAAVPWASISNLVTQNYLSVYHDYLQQEYDGSRTTRASWTCSGSARRSVSSTR